MSTADLGPRSTPDRAGRWLPRTLKARIVAGVLGLVTLLVVLIGVGTYFALRSFLYDQLDRQLQAAARQNSIYIGNCVEHNQPIVESQRLTCFTGPPPPQSEWLVARLNSSIQLSPDNYQNVTTLELSESQFAAIAANPTAVRTITYEGQRLRVTSQLNEDRTVLTVTGLSIGEVDNTLGRLITLELIIGALAVVIASTATAYGVRRSLRNLYRVTGTAQEVATELSPSGSGLDRRVPVVEEGTEVGQLAESFNTMLGAVEMQFKARLQSEERMRQFMADASHELRTPLTSIRGYAELARMQRAVGETSEDNLARIESEGTRMSRLIEDLLMLARGDAARRPTERLLIDVEDLLDDAVIGARAAFPERRIDLEVNGSPHVIGDNDQLLRAVRNLINNAAAHTDPARPILVRSWADPDGVTMQVVDGGPGLAPEQAALVFERFWRADKARTRARGGTGLGMSIVASIVSAHSGYVRFDSSVENGSTVTVRLPNAQPE